MAAGATALVAVPSSAGAAAEPFVVQVQTPTTVTLPSTAGQLASVERVVLPVGPWTVTANATAVNFGQGDFVRCQLQANGSRIDGGATVFLAGRVGGLVNAATLNSAGSTTVDLACSQDRPAATAGQFSFDPGATITAVRGGPISSPNLDTAKTPSLVESRTASVVTSKRTARWRSPR